MEILTDVVLRPLKEGYYWMEVKGKPVKLHAGFAVFVLETHEIRESTKTEYQ